MAKNLNDFLVTGGGSSVDIATLLNMFTLGSTPDIYNYNVRTSYEYSSFKNRNPPSPTNVDWDITNPPWWSIEAQLTAENSWITICDITGKSGTLLGVVVPVGADTGAGTYKYRITVDGEVFTYSKTFSTASYDKGGLFFGATSFYNESFVRSFHPVDAQRSGVAIPFASSLKVEMYSTDKSASTSYQFGAAWGMKGGVIS